MNALGNSNFAQSKTLDLQIDFDVIMTLKKEPLWDKKISKCFFPERWKFTSSLI